MLNNKIEWFLVDTLKNVLFDQIYPNHTSIRPVTIISTNQLSQFKFTDPIW